MVSRGSSTVMAGLVPAIHVFTFGLFRKDVDARHKAGHDGGEAVRFNSSWPGLSRYFAQVGQARLAVPSTSLVF
jgi:hypothetical protein